MSKYRWNHEGICRECGQHISVHRKVMVGNGVTDWNDWWCPDGSVPDPARDDDPWEPAAYEEEPRVAVLFDSYT